ncbi:MAG: hypothetical protein KGJ41_07765 [Rhodospirillales bacterium]|nr:hypothetical protein [Rhodospirillales bacterium]MDE2576133.1 hypothetical protein [Rhodospirillales bacterium]
MIAGLLSGCSMTDPYQRAGNWHPNGANNANLAAMVVAPSDLVMAAPASDADGALAVAALDRLHHDKVRALPDSGIARIATGGAGGGR